VGQGTGVMTGLVPGAAGNVPVSNGTVWASANPNIGQTWLGSVTASNSASIKFTSLIGAAYDQYVLTFESLVQATPATNALFLQVSTDNGVSWKTTGYVSNLLFSTNGSYSYEASTTGVLLRDPTLLTPYHPLFGTITIANVNDASNRVVAYGNSFYDDVGNIVIAWWGGRYDTVGAINAVQLICAAGNIVSGTAKLYGMRN
jgi:hypothetical protein